MADNCHLVVFLKVIVNYVQGYLRFFLSIGDINGHNCRGDTAKQRIENSSEILRNPPMECCHACPRLSPQTTHGSRLRAGKWPWDDSSRACCVVGDAREIALQSVVAGPLRSPRQT